jgi:hypothetical protein
MHCIDSEVVLSVAEKKRNRDVWLGIIAATVDEGPDV